MANETSKPPVLNLAQILAEDPKLQPTIIGALDIPLKSLELQTKESAESKIPDWALKQHPMGFKDYEDVCIRKFSWIPRRCVGMGEERYDYLPGFFGWRIGHLIQRYSPSNYNGSSWAAVK